MENAYIEYYTVQVGAGLQDIGPLYHNYRFVQQGSGFGSFFGALYNFLKPILVSGGKVLKNQAMKTGTDILFDLDGSKPLKEVLTHHGKKAVDELKGKLDRKFQTGSGLIYSEQSIGVKKCSRKKKYKKVKTGRKRKQSTLKRKKVKTSAKKLKQRKIKNKKLKTRILDIFGK